MRKLLFVLNIKSGKGIDNEEVLDVISSKSKTAPFEYKIYQMKGEDENNVRTLIKTFDPDTVVAAGGDGTVNFIADLLKNTHIALAILPFGSANGMAKELNIGSRFDSAMDNLVEGQISHIDLLEINGHTCIHLADVGLNARVVKRFEDDKKRGILTYAKHLFAEMFLLKNYYFKIQFDGKEVWRRGVSCTLANASKYGTGAVINPEGKLDDGKFEIIIVKPFPRIKLFSIAWKMFLNKLHTSDYVEIISCEQATVFSKRRTTLQIDGEVIGKVKEIQIRMLHKALKVVAPAPVN